LATLAHRREKIRTVLQGAGLGLLLVMVAASAVIVKRSRSAAPSLPLAAVDSPAASEASGEPSHFDSTFLPLPVTDPLLETDPAVTPAAAAASVESSPAVDDPGYPPDTRWFDGRPMRPGRTILMTVTGYSPGEESCGASADGITSSLHSVWTNGMKMVAADTRILPLGTVVSVPGYHGAQLVPVLDRGGKIKGNRLDLLYPTADMARHWGVKKVRITVWEYVDGQPNPDWRKIRDSKQ
jgi:3D (Asp-Asp-Asp) domain-containing protein